MLLEAADVQAYGAIPDSSNGLDGTDSTGAIQAAINAVGPSYRGRVYLSPNRDNTTLGYRITAPLTLTGDNISAIICGDGAASRLLGNFDDYLISRYGPHGTNGPLVIEGLEMKNYGPTGGGIFISGAANNTIRNCTVKANGVCIYLAANTFTNHIASLVIQKAGGGWPRGNVGIVASGHTSIESCDITGLTTGAVLYGPACNVHGCRFEVNVIALALGREADLTTDHALSGGSIAGNSFEANDTAICLYHASGIDLSAFTVQGSSNAPSGFSRYGLHAQYMTACTISAGACSGGFDVAAVSVDASPTNAVMAGVTARNTKPGGVVWALPVNRSGLTLVQCNDTAA